MVAAAHGSRELEPAGRTGSAAVAPPDIDVAGALRVQRQGRGDPTTSIEGACFRRATFTPEGPGTLVIDWTGGTIRAQGYGPGGDWLVDRVAWLTGGLDVPPQLPRVHHVVSRAEHRHPAVRIGGGGGLYHTLLPIVIGQRVTAREALRSWRQLVNELGEPAPGPVHLRLPPRPELVAAKPYWWFHHLGIERKRADALRTVASHHDMIAALDRAGDVARARTQLSLLPGVGEWTIGSALGPALGCTDSIAVGDYWLKHLVCNALAGRPRGTDEGMLELLAPFAGQRGRVVRLLGADGWRVERRGPGIRTLPIARL